MNDDDDDNEEESRVSSGPLLQESASAAFVLPMRKRARCFLSPLDGFPY